jgi:uncharacterized protein (TIGR04376 family)
MGLIDDMKRFLESQIDDFLSKNPHLELQVIEERLAEQKADTTQLIIDLKAQERDTETQIIATAQEIKSWHQRVQKAQDAGRQDLSQAAQQRVDALLPQGNQLWGKMQGLKERIVQAQELLQKIEQRRIELQTKAAEIQAQRAQTVSSSSNWGNSSTYTGPRDRSDPLEAQFLKWEAEEELQHLKRDLGK